MEKDPLEHFVEVHRSSFDQALPDHNLWNKIEQELPSDTKIVQMGRTKVIQFMKYAAAAIVLVSASVLGTMEYMKPQVADSVSVELVSEINEFTDYYNFEVNRKLSQLAAFDSDENVQQELSSIDAVIEELKLELVNVPKGSEEKVIDAMISNFKLKILILERLLEAKENNLNNEENQNNEINI